MLLVENEGPRPHFRVKLRHKRESWVGGDLGDRIAVLESPWAELTVAEESHREAFARLIRDGALDVVILGPVTRLGMNEAGTLQEVRDFMGLFVDVRKRVGQPVTFVLVHHENKGGTVSGAWEGGPDTLLHVQAQGHGQTRIYVKKARWDSSRHGTTLQLTWANGETFTVSDEPERDENTIVDELLTVVLARGGSPWNKIHPAVTCNLTRLAQIRDRLIAGGRIINAGAPKAMKLWHADDPARPPDTQPFPGTETLGNHPDSAPGEKATVGTVSPVPPLRGNRETETPPIPPSDDEVERLQRAAEELGLA